MPLPLAVPIISSALTSVPSWVQAFNQNRKAEQLEKELVRPEFQIPGSQTRALSSAENQAGMTRLPGQSAIEGRLDANTANQIDAVERLGPGGATSINAASQAYQMQMGKENELGVSAANMWLGNQDRLRSELNRMAEWENKAWDYNERQPYETKALAIAALKEGSMRNLNNAFQDTFGGAANILLADSLYGTGGGSEWLKNLFGLGKTTTDSNGSTASLLEGNPLANPQIQQSKNTPLPVISRISK